MDYFDEYGQDFGFDEDFINSIKELAYHYKPESDSDFEIDYENYAKVVILVSILNSISDSKFDFIYPVEMVPRYKNVSVEVDFEGLCLKDETVKMFERIISLSDMIDFVVMNDKLHFEFVVKSVFKPK